MENPGCVDTLAVAGNSPAASSPGRQAENSGQDEPSSLKLTTLNIVNRLYSQHNHCTDVLYLGCQQCPNLPNMTCRSGRCLLSKSSCNMRYIRSMDIDRSLKTSHTTRDERSYQVDRFVSIHLPHASFSETHIKAMLVKIDHKSLILSHPGYGAISCVWPLYRV